MAEILNIHDPEHLQPEVALIRNGIEYAFWQMTLHDPYGDDELKSLFARNVTDADCQSLGVPAALPAEFNTDVYANGDPYAEDLGLAQELLYLESATRLRCGESVDIVLSYLARYPTVFMLYRHKAEESLSYFEDHVVGFAHSRLTGKWFAFSPANMFNHDLSLPQTSAGSFQRMNHIIAGDTYQEVRTIVQELEGGEWPDSPDAMWRGPRMRRVLHDLEAVES